MWLNLIKFTTILPFCPAILLPESSANNPNAHRKGRQVKGTSHYGFATRKSIVIVALNVLTWKDAPDTCPTNFFGKLPRWYLWEDCMPINTQHQNDIKRREEGPKTIPRLPAHTAKETFCPGV